MRFQRFQDKYNSSFLFFGEQHLDLLVGDGLRSLFLEENLEDLADLLYNVEFIKIAYDIGAITKKLDS